MLHGHLPVDHLVDLLRDLSDQQRRVIPEHRHLLGCNLLEGLPQPLRVVVADGGEHRELRGDHVGGVEAAAQPGLDDGVLHAVRGEGDEGRRREQLELGHRPLVAGGAVRDLGRLLRALERVGERLLRDRLPADQDALSPGRDVRREVRPRGDPMRLEQGGGHPGDRGLAVGPDHMDRGEPILRHAEQRAQAPHPLQPQLPAEDLTLAQDLLGAGYPPSSSSSAR